jgi:hypothetical protein
MIRLLVGLHDASKPDGMDLSHKNFHGVEKKKS